MKLLKLLSATQIYAGKFNGQRWLLRKLIKYQSNISLRKIFTFIVLVILPNESTTPPKVDG